LSSSTDHNFTISENFYVLHVNSVDNIRESIHVTDGDDVNEIHPNRKYHHHHHQPSLISPLIQPTSKYPTPSQPSSNQIEAIIENLYHAEIINDDNIFVPAFDDFDLSFNTFD